MCSSAFSPVLFLSGSAHEGSGRCLRKWKVNVKRVKGNEAGYTLTGIGFSGLFRMIGQTWMTQVAQLEKGFVQNAHACLHEPMY